MNGIEAPLSCHHKACSFSDLAITRLVALTAPHNEAANTLKETELSRAAASNGLLHSSTQWSYCATIAV